MIRTIDSRWGPCSYFEKDEYVGKSLRYYGEYNPDETEKILELMGTGVCLDIGANIGCISMALLSAGREVIAFEPQLEVFKLLQRNCAGAECLNIGLGNEPGKFKMPKVYYSARGNFGGLGINERSIYGEIEVEVNTLDNLNIHGISFIKIDVEGFEKNVLDGGRETILRERPIMYIEDDRINQSGRLRETIRKLGYTIEEHKPPLFRPKNHFNHSVNVWDKNYCSHNLICKPC